MEDHAARVNKATHWMMTLGSELEYLVMCKLGAKYKIMLLMVYIDIFSQVWDKSIGGVGKTQKERFLNWSNSFLFNADNDVYKKHQTELSPLNGCSLYSVRNSMLHFGGLPSLDISIFITDYTKSQFCNKYVDQVKDKDVLVLTPKILYLTVIQAFILSCEKISQKDEEQTKDFMLMLERKVSQDSALPIFRSFK